MANQVSPWEPIKEMMTLRQAMDRLFDESFVRTPERGAGRPGERIYQLPVDAYATDEALIVKASLPGVNPDEVDITLDGDNLTIRTEIKTDDSQDYIIRERASGLFSRTLTLNIPVQADKIAAEFKQGVLTVTLPKAEAIKPRKIAVKSK
ncbi:MAG: Hsp20/alpha crystallin family protein [Anaerolineae bacterium]